MDMILSVIVTVLTGHRGSPDVLHAVMLEDLPHLVAVSGAEEVHMNQYIIELVVRQDVHDLFGHGVQGFIMMPEQRREPTE